jgi:hypothetical protein
MANLHLFWDGVSAPTGWTIVSDTGDAFYQNTIRGNSTYGGTGGATTHTHTTSEFSMTGASSSENVASGSTNFVVNYLHTHTIGTIVADSKSNLPNYRTLKVIKYNTADTPSTIPSGAIAIFNSSTMTGYTRYSAQDNLHIYCDGTAGNNGGSNTHTHTVSGTTNAAVVLLALQMMQILPMRIHIPKSQILKTSNRHM